MFTVLCTAMIFQASAAQCASSAALPVLHTFTALALAQQPDQPGRKGRSGDQQPSDVRDAMPAGHSPLINALEVKVIPLKYSAADTMTQLINSAMRDTLVYSNARMNAVIYMGPPGLAQKVADMIEKIDVESPNPKAESTVQIQPVKHRLADDLVRQLHSTFASAKLRLTADPGSNSIIFSGPEIEITNAVAALQALDQEAQPAQLEFAFFSAEAKKDDTPGRERMATPEDLKRVGEEIARFGVIEYQGRLTTSAMEESSFTIGGGTGRDASVEISGKIIASPADGPVKLEVMAKMALNNAAGPGPAFTLRTTVTAKRGEYVVIGSAPTGWNAGEAVILVLHVQK